MMHASPLIKDANRVAYFAIPAAVFTLVLMAVHPWYSVDYFGIVLSDNRYENMIQADFASGRYLSGVVLRVCRQLGLDTVRDYPLFVVAACIAMALFLRRTYLDFLKLPASLYWYAFFCASFLFSGAMLDLLSFREVPHHTPLRFGAAYAFLAADGIRSRMLRLGIRALVVAATFAVYQPAVSMLMVLVVLRTMFTTTRGEPLAQVWRDLLWMGLAFAMGTAAYFGMKGGIDAHGVRVSRPMLDLSDMAALHARVMEYGSAIGSLFATPSARYQWAHVGIGLGLALAAYFWRAWWTGRARFAIALGLACALIVLLQNPMNFFMQIFWPTPRSSYYWALVPGLLLAYAFAGSPSGRWRAAGQYVMIALTALYASAAGVLLNDGYELRQRDFALAQLIASEVRKSPDLEGVTKIRMPANWWDLLYPTYYQGVNGLAFEYGTPVLAVSWAVGPYLQWAAGLRLQYDGASVCSLPSSAPQIKVSNIDGRVNVCFE